MKCSFTKIGLLWLVAMNVCSILCAGLKYQQDMTFTSWKSMEAVEQDANEFYKATIGDPNIKVIDIKYKTKKNGKGSTYNAIIKCHVSEVDWDFIRIRGKIFQQKHNLVKATANLEENSRPSENK